MKTDLPKKDCFIPYVDFVAYHIDVNTLAVSFQDVTSYNGVIKTFHWDFGDGSTSDAEIPPPHKYPSPALNAPPKTYHITYTVANDCGQAFWSKDVTISPCIPDVKFQHTATAYDSVFNFTNKTNSASSTTYVWDFGDGSTTTTSATTTIQHAYANSGTYLVSLKATNICGDNFSTDSVVICKKSIPDFTYTIVNGGSVTFDASASKNVTSYQWDYGNGIKSTVQNTPTIKYDYPAPGTYTVTLIASNKCGSISVAHDIKITCLAVGVVNASAFTSDDLSFTFSAAASAPNATNYLWDFGDGTTSTLQNPGTKTYNQPGAYTLTLQASNSCSSNKSVISITAPAIANNTNAPITSFSAVTATDASTIYYLGSNGRFYRFNGINTWTDLGSIPINYNSNTHLYKDAQGNIYVFGSEGVARWTGASWVLRTSESLGYKKKATILDMDVDNAGALWTTDGSEIHKENNGIIEAQLQIAAIRISGTRLYFALKGRTELDYINMNSQQAGSLVVSNMGINTSGIFRDPANGDLYIATNSGIVRTDLNGSYSGYFSSSNTTYLNAAPYKVIADSRGYIWVLEKQGGDFIRISKSITATNAKLYNVIPDINNINDFYLVSAGANNNDIFLAKSQSNAAIRIY